MPRVVHAVLAKYSQRLDNAPCLLDCSALFQLSPSLVVLAQGTAGT